MFKKNRMFLSILCLIILFTVGGTIAYFTSADGKVNTIQMGKINVEIHEIVEGGMKKEVGATVKKETAPCWVRIFVGIPVGMQGQYLVETQPEASELTNNSLWIKDGDYYYYSKQLGGNGTEETVVLFDQIMAKDSLNPDVVPTDLDIIVYAEAVQASYGSTAVDAFNNYSK